MNQSAEHVAPSKLGPIGRQKRTRRIGPRVGRLEVRVSVGPSGVVVRGVGPKHALEVPPAAHEGPFWVGWDVQLPTVELPPPQVPGPPPLVVASPGKESATVDWLTPDNGGSPITSYTVVSTPGGITTTVDGATTSATVTGLTSKTTYTFAVPATNAVGTGPPTTSNEVTVS